MKILGICLFFILLISCVNGQNTNSITPCIEKINLLPLYGNVEKCSEQLEADKRFLSYCDSNYPSRREAAKAHVGMGWNYAEKNDRDTATKRFNQAWLLDSLNADAYWGLGIIQGSKQLYEDAEKLFQKSLSLNANNDKVWYCLAVNNKEKYANNDSEEHKKERIQYLEKALEINRNLYPAIEMLRKEGEGGSDVTFGPTENKSKSQITKNSGGTVSIIISEP